MGRARNKNRRIEGKLSKASRRFYSDKVLNSWRDRASYDLISDIAIGDPSLGAKLANSVIDSRKKVLNNWIAPNREKITNDSIVKAKMRFASELNRYRDSKSFIRNSKRNKRAKIG